jgi:cyanuric acid amidohydrolase
MRIRAWNLPTRGPADTDGLARLLDSEVRAEDVLCILGKTEGNGGRNDFTRELAMTAFEHLFAPRLGVEPAEVQDRVVFSLSGGTEGVVAPHIVVFAREDAGAARPGQKRLCAATGHTRPFRPDEIGRRPQIEETARVLGEIVAGLGVAPADVHLVQMKGAIPPVTQMDVEAARRAGRPLRCDMVWSRAASALGVALALGEVPVDRITDDAVGRDWDLYSAVASCSAKPGLERTELLVFGMSDRWGGDLTIAHGVLADILDLGGIRAVCDALALDPARDRERLVGVFAKSEADPRGTVRGQRHTMLSDDDISDTRYSRCVLSSVLAATLGETRVYVSTRAEHHGPLGGGPLAIIARAPTP